MKHKAVRLDDGDWVVDMGRKFFRRVGEGEPTRQNAELWAIVYSAHWYQEQLDKCMAKLEERGIDNPRDFLA
jgi:hypothetical protein